MRRDAKGQKAIVRPDAPAVFVTPALLKPESGVFRSYYSGLQIFSCAVILSIIAACSQTPIFMTDKIADILASPSKYSEKTVSVKGKVTESFIVFGQGYFMIADGTGAIAVIPAKTYPKVGEEVKIKGMVKNAFVVGDKSLTVIIENSQ